MKKLIYIFLGVALSLVMSSCKDWLDVNTDPDSPNNTSATVDNRLVWIEHFYTLAQGCADYRTSTIAGVVYSNSSYYNKMGTTWACPSGNPATATHYQAFFIEVASNLVDLYDKAESEGAYHYMAASNVYHALGFMLMIDTFGEIPYTEALDYNPSPAYDDGKTVFYGCLDKIDEAIELFGKEQEDGATPLSSGDMMLGGDTDKWIKFCYGLKARWLNRLSKKDDLYDADEILACIEKGPQSNSDNVCLPCYNDPNDVTDYWLGYPVETNSHWTHVARDSGQRITKFYSDLLTNMRDSGVEDPRYTKIVPAAMVNMKLDASGNVTSYNWQRSKGVDIYDDADMRLQIGGAASITATTYASTDVTISYPFSKTYADSLKPFYNRMLADGKPVEILGDTVKVTYPAGSPYVNSTNFALAGDTTYVELLSFGMLRYGSNEMDLCAYYGADDCYDNGSYAAGAISSTGSFQTRTVSDFEMLMYYEMCFIRAEAYFRQGNTSSALAAYQEGIQANLDYMESKLTEWDNSGYSAYNPDMTPMGSSAISTYMSSDAVCQSAGDLTMQDIMLQKYVAMGVSIENWTDMRRHNFSAGNLGSYGVIYPGYQRSPVFAGQSEVTGSDPTDPKYWIRRWRLPYNTELQYNVTNALAMNAHCLDTDIWCYPTWWDCETDSEYYGYLE